MTRLELLDWACAIDWPRPGPSSALCAIRVGADSLSVLPYFE